MRRPTSSTGRPAPAALALTVAAALGLLAGCSDDGIPIRPDGGSGSPPEAWAAVASGDGFGCAAAVDGRSYCWGRRGPGRLGDGDSGEASTRPVRVTADLRSDLRFDTVAAGPDHACGLTSDGEAYCWGLNVDGQLGAATPGRCPTGRGTVACSTRAVRAAAPVRFRSITVGGAHTCGVARDDRLVCWGSNRAGQLGVGRVDEGGAEPRPVLRAVAVVAAGDLHSCALTRGGDVLCWGANGDGQLGDRTFFPRSAPTVVTIRGASGLTAGARHACVLAPAHCWGRGTEGQVGDGQLRTVPFPVPVETDRAFDRLDGGGAHTCGVAADGDAFCWGAGSAGQLGTGGTPPARSVPRPVEGNRTWASIAAGGDHTCGIDAGGELWCWGRNDGGQLGDGTREDRPVPTPVETPAATAS